MKKLIQILLALLVLFIVFQFFANMLINSHKLDYSVVTSDNKYNIREIFHKSGDSNIYSFKVVDQSNNKYLFTYDVDLNKQDRIIKDIKYFKSNNLTCIYPIYKRNNVGNVSCIYNNEQVTYSYLKEIGNTDIDSIIGTLEASKYSSLAWSNSEVSKTYDRVSTYEDNIESNYIFTIWYYRGFYLVKKNNTEFKELLQNDKYENDLSLLVDKYYVMVNTDVLAGYPYSELIVYNVKDGGKSIIDLDSALSKNSYYNGIYDKKLYITDLDGKKEYALDPRAETVTKVGDTDKGFKKIENNKLVSVDSNTFLSNKVVATDNVSNTNITNKYGNVDIKKYNSNYFFKTDDGRVYQMVGNNVDNVILLFKIDDISTWKIKDDAILVTARNKIYLYNNVSGLKTIAIDNELLYNSNNIVDFMKY